MTYDIKNSISWHPYSLYVASLQISSGIASVVGNSKLKPLTIIMSLRKKYDSNSTSLALLGWFGNMFW